MTIDEAKKLLYAAGVFYYGPVEEERKVLEAEAKDEADGYWTPKNIEEHLQEVAQFQHTLNMNDTFMWALAYGATVKDDELPEVARLFLEYGRQGLYYWCTTLDDERGIKGSEFEDIQRGIDFVTNEERISKAHSGSSECAYHQESYTLGAPRK